MKKSELIKAIDKQGSEVKKSDNNLQPRGKSFSGVDDKAIINCRADLNRLVPFKYTWVWERYLPRGSVTYSSNLGMFAQQDSARVDIMDPIDETAKP